MLALMKFSVLSSGSKANCTFVSMGGTNLLIDCGLSATQAVKRLSALGIDPACLDAIIVTHEHSDHLYGVATMSRRFELPVYANPAVLEQIDRPYGREPFATGALFSIGGVQIEPFSIPHDAVDPVGFSLRSGPFKFGHATDLGKVTPLVRESLRGCQAMVVESNHDPLLLQECSYPWELKQRISSSHGHLSNEAAGMLLAELMHHSLVHVVLAHLSENSNTPEVAHHTVSTVIAPLRGLRASAGLQSLECACVARPTRLFEVSQEMLEGLASAESAAAA